MLFYAAALQTLNYDWDTLVVEPASGCRERVKFLAIWAIRGA